MKFFVEVYKKLKSATSAGTIDYHNLAKMKNSVALARTHNIRDVVVCITERLKATCTAQNTAAPTIRFMGKFHIEAKTNFHLFTLKVSILTTYLVINIFTKRPHTLSGPQYY